MPKDYVDQRLEKAVEKAAEVLLSHLGEWSNEVDAYWLLRRHEDKVGVPVTYDIVEAAIAEVARRLGERVVKPFAVKAEA